MSTKKIAVIDPSCFTWPYDRALVEGLRALGHDAVLYTKFLEEGEPGKGIAYVEEVFYPGFQTAIMKSLPRSIFLALKGASHIVSLVGLWLRLRKDKPDVIHFQWTPLPVIDRLFIPALRRIAPVVLTVHDSSPFNNSPSSRLQGMRSIEIMKSFDCLIVHTEKARAALGVHGVDPKNVVRIEHGLLGKEMSGAIKPLASKAVGEPVTVLLFGYLKHYKGADILIEALAKIPMPSRAAIRLRIAGKPLMDTEPLFARARQLDVEDSIRWDLRFIDDDEVLEMFETSDITAMPYREIDASGVLMVALAIGRPIVASRIGLFAELVEDGKHGFLVPMEDPDALAVALTRLVEDPGLRSRMGSDVRALGKSIPTWEQIAEKTDQLYARAMLAHA
ncbi:glycosyltransferase family 4 protein [Variovorax sp. LT1P1]|uniref:glycosyltransferase family 4 protein n=1 Tax=Variovorax sp. LT1P1 TaxID=3443730 RepID=UPI003F45FD9F